MKARRMLVEAILLVPIIIAYGYNVDTDFPIIYSYQEILKDRHPSFGNSYFGYTVQLHHDLLQNSSWLIVGAPKGNYSQSSRPKSQNPVEPGVAYRCAINKTCQEIKPKKIENEEGYIEQLRLKIRIKKQNGWFGGAIAIDRLNGILTVCAPRTIISIINPFVELNADSMHGMCYSEKVSSNVLSIEEWNLAFYDFESHFWYNPIHGFSIHYATIKGQEEREIGRITGEPEHETYGTAYIEHSNKRLSVELPFSGDLSHFGYSVESGYFFNKTQLLYASGAPGWQYVGQVVIINPNGNSSFVTKLDGTDIGEFFGASLAVGDLNKDGLDDLVIGAPHWGQDHGRVYAYFGTSKGQFETAVILQGATEGGHFGYAVACGDLDADGFDDVIVGAPWEENGVIYVYNGGADLKDKNLEASQRIEVAKLLAFNSTPRINSFGFSISKPVDIDGNGYLDIAVGAYKSEQAVVFFSKPVVKTQLVIQTIPNILQRYEDEFLILICPLYDGYNIKVTQQFKITVTIDERYQRTKETFLELNSSDSLSDMCLITQINIKKNILDFIEPISIFASHEFVYDNTSNYFCKFCPVERRNSKLKAAQILVPFNIGCGEDKVCNCNISAAATFHGVRDNNTWVIGSTDISLEVSLKNYGEPAYLTTLEFMLPEGIVLRSILPTCQEDTSKENLIVICNAGNPIWEEEEKSIILDLDMKHMINGSLHDHKLNFDITIETRSNNSGTAKVTKMLNLLSEVSLSLNGKANEETYYLSASNDISNISFQHTYQIYKLGATPIEDAQIIIKVPTVLENSEPLVHVYKPQLYVSGEIYNCFSDNIEMDTEITVGLEPSLDQFNMHLLSNEMRQIEESEMHRRDLNESIDKFYDLQNIKIPESANDSLAADFIYLSCSSFDVRCSTITCDLSALKTLQDIGKVVIKFLLNVERLKDTFANDRVVLKFNTEATVEIIKPAARLSFPKTRSTMEIVTMFYNSPKMEELHLWIIVVSVLLGLLLLLALATILSTMGFFRRKNKQDITTSKNGEMTEEGMKMSNS